MSRIIISRVPFRLSLGGGSTDLPSYSNLYGGFIFAVTVNLYMDVFVKAPRSDDLIHVHYKDFESVPTIEEVKHEIVREALRMHKVNTPIAFSFKADTPAGTGLGSSGACAVAVHRGIAAFLEKEMTNRRAAELSFELTQRLGLPDGVQDPYVCAEGGFVTLGIDPDGAVTVRHPRFSSETVAKFFENCLFVYTGVTRESEPILRKQNDERIFELKHKSKTIGYAVYESFKTGRLDDFGELLDEYWQLKKCMSSKMSSEQFDEVYNSARRAGALGGKIMGAGGGGYFMFYCPSPVSKRRVQRALLPFRLREMQFALDAKGARVRELNL